MLTQSVRDPDHCQQNTKEKLRLMAASLAPAEESSKICAIIIPKKSNTLFTQSQLLPRKYGVFGYPKLLQ
jgi:hypothetical protein